MERDSFIFSLILSVPLTEIDISISTGVDFHLGVLARNAINAVIILRDANATTADIFYPDGVSPWTAK
jgi:hypothetical protein